MKASAYSVVLSLLFALTGCGEPKAPSNLEKAHESEHAEPAPSQVKIDAAAAREAGIEISTVGPATLKENLSLYGVIRPNAERTRKVVARFPGVVKSVNKGVGDKVAAGDVLANVESNDSLKTYAIKAPIAGVITARNVNDEENVADEPLFTITDLSTVWAELSLFPRDVTRVRLNQSVNVRSTEATTSGNGAIKWLASLGDTATQSLTARVQLDNAQSQWTPGLYVTGEVTLSEQPVALAVQSDAVQNLDGNTVVFTETKDGFAVRAVKIGRSDSAMTEILSGLAPDTRYVSANSFVIKADIEKSSAEHDH